MTSLLRPPNGKTLFVEGEYTRSGDEGFAGTVIYLLESILKKLRKKN